MLVSSDKTKKGTNLKLKKWFVAGLLVLALPFSTAAECKNEGGTGTSDGRPGFEDPKPGPKRPGCPDIEFRADDERCFVLQTFVESRLGPYDVYLKIDGGAGAYPREIPVAGGGWKHSVVYRTGVKLSIRLTLRYEGEQSRDGFCSITDDLEFVKNKLRSIRNGGGSPYEAVCILTTSQ